LNLWTMMGWAEWPSGTASKAISGGASTAQNISKLFCQFLADCPRFSELVSGFSPWQL
jgi:hypothetical protein